MFDNVGPFHRLQRTSSVEQKTLFDQKRRKDWTQRQTPKHPGGDGTDVTGWIPPEQWRQLPDNIVRQDPGASVQPAETISKRCWCWNGNRSYHLPETLIKMMSPYLEKAQNDVTMFYNISKNPMKIWLGQKRRHDVSTVSKGLERRHDDITCPNKRPLWRNNLKQFIKWWEGTKLK